MQPSAETKKKLYDYYRTADKYIARIDASGEEGYREYVNIVEEFTGQRKNILDLACGSATTSKMLSRDGHQVTGMDISALFLEKALVKKNANLKFICGDILNIPFKNGAFDCVSIYLSIEHLVDIPQALNEMLRVIKTGGRLIILSPNMLSPFNVLFPVINTLRGRKVDFMFGINNLWRIGQLLVRNTLLLIRKKCSRQASFNYREPVLENRIDFIPDNDAVYLTCPIDFKRYFGTLKNVKILNYQCRGRIGKIFPNLSTGIYIAVEKR